MRANLQLSYTSSGFRRAAYHLLFLLTLLASFFYLPLVRAQDSQFAVATTMVVSDSAEAVDGDIVSLVDEVDTVARTKVGYDQKMHGVVVMAPAALYRTVVGEGAMPVVRAGISNVNVTTQGGDIAVGDYITSSDIPGKGQKATETNGYMLGIALSSFKSTDEGTDVTANGKTLRQGQVKVAVGIGPASPVVIKAAGGIFGTLKKLTEGALYNISSSKQAERIIRWILAVLVAIMAIALSYRAFGRNVTKGMEAIGRNPLAKASIQTMIVLNIAMILMVSLGGIVLSLVILSL